MGKRIIISERMLKPFLRQMMLSEGLLTEISSNDAYNRFYKNFCSPEEWESFMRGAPTMTPLHKYALDVMKTDCYGWDKEIADAVSSIWNSKDNEGRKYLIDIINMWNSGRNGYSKYAFIRFLNNTKQMKRHTEAKFADNGLVVLYESDTALVTCTTSYSASKKYYGDSRWCTASDIGDNYNGFDMFCQYSESEGCALIQCINKANRSKSLQAQVDWDGNIESACDFNDKSLTDNFKVDKVGLLLKEMGLSPSFFTEIPQETLKKLIDLTIENVKEESDYWRERSREMDRKKRAEFSRGVSSGKYEELISKIGVSPDVFQDQNITDGESQMFASVRDKSSIQGCFVISAELNGTNESERNWISQRIDQYGSETISDISDYTMVVSNTNPQKVVGKFQGSFCGVFGNLILTEVYSYSYDTYEKSLYHIFSGKLVAKNVSDVEMKGDEVAFFASSEDYEDGCRTKVDANTGNYICKFKGSL